jgi:basic membrane lipoprotein Med (substrate-binding protein (PBP1-ABC) superfamily)
MTSKTVLLLLTLAVLLVVTSSFQLSSKANPTFTNRRSTVSMNFFDNLKVIFSKEGQENIKAFNDREKEEALIAQKEILARRADPKKMREYEEKNDANRRKLAEERAVYKFQGVVKEGSVDMLARLS